jgi:putative transposase
MGRPLRAAAGGILYHVWNRGNGRQSISEKAEDYEAFDRVLMAAHERVSMRIGLVCDA